MKISMLDGDTLVDGFRTLWCIFNNYCIFSPVFSCMLATVCQIYNNNNLLLMIVFSPQVCFCMLATVCQIYTWFRAPPIPPSHLPRQMLDKNSQIYLTEPPQNRYVTTFVQDLIYVNNNFNNTNNNS